MGTTIHARQKKRDSQQSWSLSKLSKQTRGAYFLAAFLAGAFLAAAFLAGAFLAAAFLAGAFLAAFFAAAITTLLEQK